MELLIRSGVNIFYSIIRMTPFTAMLLSWTVNILLMLTVIYGIRNTYYLPPQFLGFVSCRLTSKIIGIGSVIPRIKEDVFRMHKINIIFRWTMLSKLCLLDQLKNSYMELLIRSGVNIFYSIIIMIPLTVMILSGTVKILLMVTFIYGIKNTRYHPPQLLVLYLAG